MDDYCEFCQGTRQLTVLNVWKMQRRYRVNGGDVDKAVGVSADDLPFIVIDDACPACCGDEASEAAHKDLEKRMGGNPWEVATYDGTGEA